ncbi:hypothetical protein COT27_03515 [Candidatus Kuenenbacteria bacterium CG08_land_8_20_14_0_20_37_23]|uniref:Peptidase S1 domain-containing protein n=1 Tax=Candidatus Kuenenbacteria bacterium CG08_land_8_20_14_0_20_37_23 TaxID=1974617 RepID=A0A2M6XRU8_9BACT|nr:MAG: hypothetical protein COT27_03515 [Candidatus Kuenenbacteria bacterium CG08_land_8_20_14_0_20_37_23]
MADIYNVSNDEDIAILKLRNPNNKIFTYIDITKGNSSSLRLGDKLTLYGYPPDFGDNITFTDGSFSGIEGNYLKTNAIVEHGNSGGGAYLENGNFIGIPSAAKVAKLNTIGYILSIDKIKSWMNGSSYAYNSGVNNNYSRVAYLLDEIDLSALDSLGLFIPGDEIRDDTVKEQKPAANIDTKLSSRLKGKLLLQVEDRGRIWYVNPDDSQKFEVTFANALPLFQKFALGITNKDLSGIPQNNEAWTSSIGNRLKGKLLLQVEDKGRIWYVDFNGKKWEVTWANLMGLFQKLALGITNADLNKIEVVSLE